MRPQRNAAENERLTKKTPFLVLASMRPQRNAAENPRRAGPSNYKPGSFNEAAA